MKKSMAIAALVLFVTCITGVSLAEQLSPADFYKKNKVTLILGTGAGGGSDVGGRLIAKFWPEVTGGEMVVKNMPGAGGILAVNYMANNCKPDGLTLHMMMFGSSYLSPHLTKNKAAKYDPTKFNYVLGAYVEPWLMVTAKGLDSVEAMKAKGSLRYSIINPLENNNFAMLPFLRAAGIKVKVVTGFGSQSEAMLSVGKGEADVALGPITQTLRQVEQGVLQKPFMVMERERLAELPDVPSLFESVQMTPESMKLFEECSLIGMAVRVAAFAEGVPQDRVQYVRDAMARMEKLPEFQKEVKNIFMMGSTFMSQQELDDFVKKSFSIDFEHLLNELAKNNI